MMPNDVPDTATPERRHTVSIWLKLLGVLAVAAGAALLYFEDYSAVRATLAPRTEGTIRGSLAAIFSTEPRAGDLNANLSREFSTEFIDGLWSAADAAGVRRATFERAFASSRTSDPEVLALNANQPEFERTTGDYVTQIVSAERVATGRERLAQNTSLVAEIERRYGVDRHILLAIWGIESNYGSAKGERNVIRSLATLTSADARRAAFWHGELIAALTIAEQDRIAPDKMLGSWAGAMGHTQFMPSTYLKHAVDFDGDGVRDVWTSIADALASSAHYLQAAGWTPGRPWGREVALPPEFDFALATPTAGRMLSSWRLLGVRLPTGAPLPIDDQSLWQVVVPSGAGGPAFLVSTNFEAILTYNRAYPYAIAVGTLADRIAGVSTIQALWPAGDLPMTREQRTELQQILAALGFDPGAIDGIVGGKTRDAIRSFQKTRSLPADGHPSLVLLNRLRSQRRL